MDLLELGNPKTDPSALLKEFHGWMLENDEVWIINRSQGRKTEDPVLSFSSHDVHDWIRKRSNLPTKNDRSTPITPVQYLHVHNSVETILKIWIELDYIEQQQYLYYDIVDNGCEIVGEY